MKIKHYLSVALAAIILSGCYNDDKLWDAVNKQEERINDHDKRLETLENTLAVINNNIQALQVLISGQVTITQVTPIILDGETVGYTFEFTNHDPISIYNGEKGEQGDKGEQGEKGDTGEKGDDAPMVSLVQQDDNNWYWTLNGELMKDANGNPIRANGLDGADGLDGQNGTPGQDGQPGVAGTDAPVPVLRTGQQLNDEYGKYLETAAIYLSVDNGVSWEKVSDGVIGLYKVVRDGNNLKLYLNETDFVTVSLITT